MNSVKRPGSSTGMVAPSDGMVTPSSAPAGGVPNTHVTVKSPTLTGVLPTGKALTLWISTPPSTAIGVPADPYEVKDTNLVAFQKPFATRLPSA